MCNGHTLKVQELKTQGFCDSQGLTCVTVAFARLAELESVKLSRFSMFEAPKHVLFFEVDAESTRVLGPSWAENV